MDIYEQIVVKIILAQEAIIGPVAVEQAQQVSGLDIDWVKRKISIIGDKAAAIDQLVKQYEGLFGQISVEVCRESAAALIRQLTPEQLPEALK